MVDNYYILMPRFFPHSVYCCWRCCNFYFDFFLLLFFSMFYIRIKIEAYQNSIMVWRWRWRWWLLWHWCSVASSSLVVNVCAIESICASVCVLCRTIHLLYNIYYIWYYSEGKKIIPFEYKMHCGEPDRMPTEWWSTAAKSSSHAFFNACALCVCVCVRPFFIYLILLFLSVVFIFKPMQWWDQFFRPIIYGRSLHIPV